MLRSKLNLERAVALANEHQNPLALNRYLALNQLQQVKERLERLSWRSYLLKDRQRDFRGRRPC